MSDNVIPTKHFQPRLLVHGSALVAVLLLGPLGSAKAESATRPNVIFILADDLGWAELGCYGNTFNETPHLDKLAEDGVRFTQAYAAAPVCSPYRASLLTGMHPARVGITDYLRPNSANALSTEYRTLAEVFRDQGYSTGMIGKWHLTGYEYHDAEHEVRPGDHGFQWDFATERKGVGNGANFWPYVFRDQPIRWVDIDENRLGENEYLVDRMNVEAVDFIRNHKDKPFFLYLSHYATHTILNGKPEIVERYRRKHPPGPSTRDRSYLSQDAGLEGDALNHWAGDHNPHLAAMLESIDDGVGMIAQELDRLGLADNTIVIFSSDNGGETNVTSNAPLRGGKSELYEGGIRVPLIIRWPGRMPRSAVCEHPTSSIDFLPTLSEAGGASVPETDGISMLDSWLRPEEEREPRTLHWHYPLDKNHFLGGVSAAAIRDDSWKLIQNLWDGSRELYSLAEDIGETRDLSQSYPQQVERLSQKLVAWQTKVGARVPSPPMLVQPAQLLFADHFSSSRANSRWWFNKDWSVEDGVLRRGSGGGESTRIFLRDSEYRDCLIRFDVRFKSARDVRLVTGSNGPYNTVIHLRPDHFFIQTAKDSRGPYFSFRHGECAMSFDPDRWYSVTVEFAGNRCLAHVDRDHVVAAEHPIIDKPRTYVAFQVDEGEAEFDNVQILSIKGNDRDLDKRWSEVLARVNRFPVKKTAEEEFQIAKTNGHEWLYQRDSTYRDLIAHVDKLDKERELQFPAAFESMKYAKKKLAEERKRLTDQEPRYKELRNTTHQAARDIEAYLISLKPEIAELPDSRRKRAIETVRRSRLEDPEYRRLVQRHRSAESTWESAYSEVFVSDDLLKQRREQAYDSIREDPQFKKINDERAAAYRAQQDYLFEKIEGLAELRDQAAK